MDFKQTLENCKVVALRCDTSVDGKKYYKIGILQGREHCEMLSCDEHVAVAFNPGKMFDQLCRITYRTINSRDKGSWTVVTDIDFIKTQDGK